MVFDMRILILTTALGLLSVPAFADGKGDGGKGITGSSESVDYGRDGIVLSSETSDVTSSRNLVSSEGANPTVRGIVLSSETSE